MTEPPAHEEPRPFGGDYFHAFQTVYFPVHGYLAIVMCSFGIVANSISITVLTRRRMITPTNVILTALALSHLLLMTGYAPFAWHQYILKSNSRMIAPDAWRSYSWISYIGFSISYLIVVHTISVWLTVELAVFHAIAVALPTKVQHYCSMKRALTGIAMITIGTALICTPSYLRVQVSKLPKEHAEAMILDWVAQHEDSDLADDVDASNATDYVNNATVYASNATDYVSNATMYRLEESDFSRNHSHIPRTVSFYAFSIVCKLVPCLVLICLSAFLVGGLVRRRRLGFPQLEGRLHGLEGSPANRDRTTRLVIGVILCLIITELPTGLLALFSAFSHDFFTFVYVPLGDLMDILALINHTVIFVLCCSISPEFQQTLCRMFGCSSTDSQSADRTAYPLVTLPELKLLTDQDVLP
ncbi:hypothetical protein BV898_15116 [Hypsibius exemplaris]|uniref:G-protein coupled receptors family 1 profile domain-containing protein n=1 Tax=Hypsibius exemplaris TaxID=2072580 RepID=A0A9X6NAU9_HYPEX|nr:hypothetical protein BV898_15116 [Hypsibius exemplaris]